MIIPILVISAITLGALVLVARPLLAPSESTTGAIDPAVRELDDALERSLDSIDEIAFDHATGHLSDADYAALDHDERARAIELLRRKDRLNANE